MLAIGTSVLALFITALVDTNEISVNYRYEALPFSESFDLKSAKNIGKVSLNYMENDGIVYYAKISGTYKGVQLNDQLAKFTSRQKMSCTQMSVYPDDDFVVLKMIEDNLKRQNADASRACVVAMVEQFSLLGEKDILERQVQGKLEAENKRSWEPVKES
jgi:hypothetical protein